MVGKCIDNQPEKPIYDQGWLSYFTNSAEYDKFHFSTGERSLKFPKKSWKEPQYDILY